ncbi:SDR family oxidoreductase [Agromyces archimandritae]|uniref:SDR family oxidoreductase n=1 Tax=Agromyces archimandritae TaxID=2781962 RepID=A0A975FQK3_9MICO|nr:SDR family oxidoreductase [Agromyces archimandritae]QTX06192.1 SDR family oxidoreductase [Agromyces archimandritae]
MAGPFDLDGRVALISGSSRGIGKALAAALAEAGATVVLNGVDPDRLAGAERELAGRFGDRIRSAAFDVTDESAVRDGVADVEGRVGPIDVLVNNAGVQHRVPLLELELADWERVVRIDLTSAFILGRAVAAGMVARGSGKIINICSVQSELGRPSIGAYTAAKGGLRNLTRAMTAEWASAGIQINGLAPGYIHSDMTQALVDDPDFDAWLRARTPAGRWGTPADLGGPAVWLASSASDYVNGQVILVDGGMTVVV